MVAVSERSGQPHLVQVFRPKGGRLGPTLMSVFRLARTSRCQRRNLDSRARSPVPQTHIVL
jgi:hypothetical protein